MEERLALAERMKTAREYLGLSQQEVADHLKISRSAVSLMENGQRKIETLELKALASLYQRPVGYFTGEEVAQERPEEVEMLARKAEQLSPQDREELLRFSEFLMQRAQASKGHGDKT
ncbi:Helix-turn-helix [Variovorax sp. YR750]|uniref:helix-turn-helix domain-containing protein n=1 Tax=Variovorax sp. YR750 TaxID=1884384 RepID=UPI0008C41B64|nr:helix-turn-helix transcriptional regulator [Variovorax sp. YR750]SEM14894.1 Helix-turn-helix [Variovorax sp. YR750]